MSKIGGFPRQFCMRFAALPLLAGLSLRAQNAGQETEATTTLATETVGGLARYEPGIMLVTATAILILAVITLRLLSRKKMVDSPAWIMPLIAALSLIVLVGLHFGFPGRLPKLHALMWFSVSFCLFVAVLFSIARVVLPSKALMTRAGVPPLVGGIGAAVVAFIGMFVLLSWTFPGLEFRAMFLTSGVASLVIGLSLQDLLTNLMAGIVFGVERPFKIGDWVRIGDIEGEVVELHWRVTKLRTRQWDYELIPNAIIAKAQMTNYNLPTANHLHKILVGVSYATPPGIAVEALVDAARSVEEVLPIPAPEAHFRDFQDSALLYELRIWIDNYASMEAIEHEVRKAIWYSFKRHGITIPFPQRDVHFFKAPTPQLSTIARLIVTAGPLRGAMFPLGDAVTTIGRLPGSDVCVSDRHVSGNHATIAPCEGGYVLTDLGSRHGTIVNGNRVQEARLEQGDEIKVGPVCLMFERCEAPAWGFTAARAKVGMKTATAEATDAGETKAIPLNDREYEDESSVQETLG